MRDKDRMIIDVDYSALPDGAQAFSKVYDLIADAAGVNPDDVGSFDCRLIDCSPNGQDMIYEKVGKQVSDTVQITMALAMSGMKVDTSLPPNTAVIYRDGIVLKDGKDLLDMGSGENKGISLFLSSDCIDGSRCENYYKRILVLKPEKLKGEYRDSKYQLWLPYSDTFGCDPNARGQTIYAVCLYDGEVSTVNWRRDDFLGVLKPDRIPPFVSENGYYDMFMKDQSFTDVVDKAVVSAQLLSRKGAQAYER